MNDRLGIFLMNWRVRMVLPQLQGDVLDIGCGTNELMKVYKTRHNECRTVGIDIYPWLGVDQVVPNSADLPFEDASFDTVCCIAALNHIPEREEVLHEAWRILRPEGCLVLTMLTPGLSRIWHFLRSPWDVDQHERGMKKGEVYGLNSNTMKSMLEAAGFSITRTSRFMLGMNKLYVAEKF